MTGIRFTLVFPPASSTKPITYMLIKKYDIEVNILKAEITAGKEGRLLMELKGREKNLQEGIKYLEDEGIKVVPLEKQISLNKEDCVHCGACTSVCFPGALSMDKKSWRLQFEPSKCVVCGLCVFACPLRIINISFGQEEFDE